MEEVIYVWLIQNLKYDESYILNINSDVLKHSSVQEIIHKFSKEEIEKFEKDLKKMKWLHGYAMLGDIFVEIHKIEG